MGEPFTLDALLRRAAEHPDVGLRLIGRDERETWTSWPEVVDRAVKTGAGIQALGVRPGDRVAMVLPTSRDFFDVFFGTLLAGGVPVPLYPPVRLGRLEEYATRTSAMIRAVSARVVLTDRRIRSFLGRSILDSRPEMGCLRVDQLPGARLRPHRARPDDLAVVQFSSGTTVEPKPVALSHRALLVQARGINSFWPARDDRTDSGVSWLPLYHDMGLIGCLLPALERPGTLTLIPPEVFVAHPAIWLRAISRFRATLSVGPTFAYAVCADKINDSQLEGVDLSSWRVALCGAEPVVPRVLRRFADRFSSWGFDDRALTPVYGLSEAALAVTFSDLRRPFGSRQFDRELLSGAGRAVEADSGVELASVGKPLPGFGVRIVDRDGLSTKNGRVGEVEVRGPSIMQGYLDRPEETLKVLEDGWLKTGDLGFLHDGELYISGRAKDVLILRGQNHDPAELEDAVGRVDGVRAGCAVAASWLPHDADGEVLLMIVEARAGLDEDRYPTLVRECAAAVRARTSLSPDQVEIVPPGTLPRTSSGKMRRAEALRRYLDGELTPPEPVTAAKMFGAAVRSSVDFARARWHERD
jgi:acyl-CoA synthetase (AMP-forming)/AMP-acid ligase II